MNTETQTRPPEPAIGLADIEGAVIHVGDGGSYFTLVKFAAEQLEPFAAIDATNGPDPMCIVPAAPLRSVLACLRGATPVESGAPELANGLTEAETTQTASVAGLTSTRDPHAPLIRWLRDQADECSDKGASAIYARKLEEAADALVAYGRQSAATAAPSEICTQSADSVPRHDAAAPSVAAPEPETKRQQFPCWKVLSGLIRVALATNSEAVPHQVERLHVALRDAGFETERAELAAMLSRHENPRNGNPCKTRLIPADPTRHPSAAEPAVAAQPVSEPYGWAYSTNLLATHADSGFTRLRDMAELLQRNDRYTVTPLYLAAR